MQSEQSSARSLSFLDQYNATIAPKLKDIDIYMKTGTKNVTVKAVSKLLYISEQEVKEIMSFHHITKLDCHSFFEIMRHGSSEICQFFSRELQRGIPKLYSPSDISYIYNIDIDIILDACQKIGITEFDYRTLPLLFSNIILDY